MIVSTDVDIDVASRDKVLEKLQHIDAGIMRQNEMQKHNTGVYFQPIPFDPRTGVSTIDHKEAESLGYFKIDLLNNTVYEEVRSEKHLIKLLNTEPLWDLLLSDIVIEQLFHVNNYGHLLKKFKPKSVEELAMLLAIIRPAKAYLQEKNWNVIKDRVWEKEGDEYSFKKSHAIAYASVIVVQLNLITEKAMSSS